MSPHWIAFFVGLFIGSAFGVVVIGLLAGGKRADLESEIMALKHNLESQA